MSDRCKCGHPREAHGPQEWPPGQGRCRATVYENVPNGMNAWPCKCSAFRAQAGALSRENEATQTALPSPKSSDVEG